MSFLVINWKPDKKELRTFGLLMLGGFTIIGLLLYFAPWPVWWTPKPTAGIVCWITGLLSGLLGVTGTKIALPFYWAWMGIAFVTGNITYRVALILLYYCIITPLALIARLIGRDRLKLRRRDTMTYWEDVPRTVDISRYERQF